LEGLNLNEAVEKIRGEKGSEVTILVERKGSSDPFEVTLTRDDIPIETVYTDVKDVDGKKTGIIEMNSFSETTSEEFDEALKELQADEIECLVINVLGETGGLVECVEVILDHSVNSDITDVQIDDSQG